MPQACWRRFRIACILLAVSPPARARHGRLVENAMAKDDPNSSGMGNAIGGAETVRAGGAADSGLRPQIAYTDLREWIEEARKLGEIREVRGLTWQSDIGAAAEVVLHDENAPCVVLEDIPGTLRGSKVRG